MPKKIISPVFILILLGLIASSLLLPKIILAQDGPALPNPISGENEEPVNVIAVILRIIQIALAIVDIFALFMFIYGGFQFLISAGNPEIIKKAKGTLVWATIGILVITLSYSILKFIFEGISQGTS